MKKRRISRAATGFVVLVVLVIALMLSNTLRSSPRIVLPEETETPGQTEENPSLGGDALTVVAVTPDTVQAAIETLARPETYRRSIKVQQFWSGGSGTVEATVTVSGAWTRVDRTLSEDRVRHTVTDGEITYIWYNNERELFAAPAGSITADVEQAIPTYEDILALPVEEIAAADYQVIFGVNCICVETTEDKAGYMLRYWVSLDNGLLMAAEKLQAGETVYRMWQTDEDLAPTIGQEFTLPDGTVLHE